MTGGDLVVLAPWVIFGACLAVICIRLLAWRRASRRHSPPGRHLKPSRRRR
ncbi:MAG TPA: hypothetical protein VH642_16185 [Streptosporangiaceae bacterium]|jgi:hypothetical protein